MPQNIITAGNSVSGALTTQAGNDGTLAIVVGPSGGQVNGLSLAADGTPTFVKQPQFIGVPSMIRLNTANGYGSTNTKYRRFLNTVINQGSDITYADSATLSSSFTINTSGIYSISYSDVFGGISGYLGITLNDNQGATNIQSSTIANVLTINHTPAANWPGNVATTVYLPAGSVINAKTDGVAYGGTDPVLFTITRVA